MSEATPTPEPEKKAPWLARYFMPLAFGAVSLTAVIGYTALSGDVATGTSLLSGEFASAAGMNALGAVGYAAETIGGALEHVGSGLYEWSMA